MQEFIPRGGFFQDPEHNAGKNWSFLGASDVWEIITQIGDWFKFGSPPERQDSARNTRFDCVSISLAGNIEKWLNYLMSINPAVRPILDMLGLLDENGFANVSEKYIATGSGTIPGRGNSQYAVYEFVRKNGIVGEKMWPSTLEMTDEQFYSPLTPEIRALGKKFLEYFDFNYKDVGESPDDRKEALKRSPLCVVVGGAYLGDEQGATLYRNSGTPSYNHQLQIGKQDRDVSIFSEVVPVIDRVEDSYEPLLKDYAGTYPFKFVKIIRLTLKKKLPNMPQVVRQTGQRNCYLYIPELDIYSPIEDSQPITSPVNGVTAIVAGGDIVKPFSGGKYPNIPEVEIPQEKIFGRVKITL